MENYQFQKQGNISNVLAYGARTITMLKLNLN